MSCFLQLLTCIFPMAAGARLELGFRVSRCPIYGEHHLDSLRARVPARSQSRIRGAATPFTCQRDGLASRFSIRRHAFYESPPRRTLPLEPTGQILQHPDLQYRMMGGANGQLL